MNELLPDDLVWEVEAVTAGPEGASHLSEIALTAIADGEEAILPMNARSHAETCDACARKLGEAAMLSSAIGAALRGAATGATMAIAPAIPAIAAAQPVVARDSNRPRARIPVGGIAAGVALAVLGAIPMLLDLPAYLADARLYAYRGLPVIFRSGVSVARSNVFNETASMLTAASAFVLVLASFFLLRRLPAQRLTQGAS